MVSSLLGKNAHSRDLLVHSFISQPENLPKPGKETLPVGVMLHWVPGPYDSGSRDSLEVGDNGCVGLKSSCALNVSGALS